MPGCPVVMNFKLWNQVEYELVLVKHWFTIRPRTFDWRRWECLELLSWLPCPFPWCWYCWLPSWCGVRWRIRPTKYPSTWTFITENRIIWWTEISLMIWTTRRTKTQNDMDFRTMGRTTLKLNVKMCSINWWLMEELEDPRPPPSQGKIMLNHRLNYTELPGCS